MTDARKGPGDGREEPAEPADPGPAEGGGRPDRTDEVDPEITFGRREARTEAADQHSVLRIIEAQTGVSAKVMLSEEPSAHGAPPVVAGAPGEAPPMPPGRGSYQLHGEIARGGMGAILKGHDTDLGRDVAIKVLLKKHADNPAILQRFVEEAQIGGQLQHPGIVPVYEMGLMSDDRPYFTMKLVKGRTFSALLSERKDAARGRRRLLAMFEQVCQTMAYAHSRRVIHRDLKPANIMVGAFGEVQIVDWGLSKVIRAGGVADELQARQTEVSIIETVRSGPGSSGTDSLAGSVMGTPAYMSPEQAQGEIERLDERTDVFALGAILCQILTGAPPYLGDTDHVVVEAAKARLDGAHERLRACGADEQLVEIAIDCLMPSRAVRPRSAEVLATRLSEYLAEVEERARAAQVAAAEERVKAEDARRAKRLTLALAATVLVALVGAGGGYLWTEQASRDRAAHARGLADEALANALPLEAAGRWTEALAFAEKAQLAAASPDADAELATYVARVTERLRDGHAAELERQANEERNRQFLAVLEPIQLTDDVSDSRLSNEARSTSFAEAFRDFGIDVGALSDTDAAAAIAATGIGVEVAQALDEWARVETGLSGFGSESREKLLRIAMLADPDPWRTRLREAVLEDDPATLRALAASDEVASLPPESIWTLCHQLWDLGHREPLRGLLARAQRRHPDDFFMNFFRGSELRWGAPNRPEEGLRYLMAAHALRPDSKPTLRRITTIMTNVEDFEAMDHFAETVLEHDPDNWRALNHRSWYLANEPASTDADRLLAAQMGRRAVENCPQENAYNVMNTFGVALYRAGEWATAIKVLARAEELGSIPENWIFQAMAHARLGQADDARRCLAVARTMVPGPDADDETERYLADCEALVRRM